VYNTWNYRVYELCPSSWILILKKYNITETGSVSALMWREGEDRPTRSRFSVVFLDPRTNPELVPKFHVTLHASHAALPMVTLKISPYSNVTLAFDFDFGLDHPVHGGYGWGSPTPRRRRWRPGNKTNWPTQYNLKLNLRHCTTNYGPVLSSERAPYMKNKESNCHSNKCNTWSLALKGARHQDELADAIYLEIELASLHWKLGTRPLVREGTLHEK
jgi:hypothetical protein